MGKIGNAIGVLEISYYSNTVVVVDQALKAAEVDIVSFHRKLGGKLCHAVLAGGTSAVEAAMEAAVQGADAIKVAAVINAPHPEIMKLLNMIEEVN